MSGRTARGTMTSKLGTRQVCASTRTEGARSVLRTEVGTRCGGDEVALAHRGQSRPVQLVGLALVVLVLAQHVLDRHRDQMASLPRFTEILDALGEIEDRVAQHTWPPALGGLDRQQAPIEPL